MNPPTPQRSGYRTLFIAGAVFVLIAIAIMVGSIFVARTDTSNGMGAAEAAGFMFMTGLAPCALGTILLVIGFVVFLQNVSRR